MSLLHNFRNMTFYLTFQPYYAVETGRECLSGIALDLALSKALVELHNGKLWMKSNKGKGNIFGLSITLSNFVNNRRQ